MVEVFLCKSYSLLGRQLRADNHVHGKRVSLQIHLLNSTIDLYSYVRYIGLEVIVYNQKCFFSIRK